MINFFKKLKNLGIKISIQNKNIKKVFWGVAPTGDIHIGYLPYIAILKKLKSMNFEIMILIADYHGYLDSEKTLFSQIEERTQRYYHFFKRLGFSDQDIVFAKDEYLKSSYINSLFLFSRSLKLNESLKCAKKTLKSFIKKNFHVSDVLYVLTQVFDLEYFQVDLVLSGIDESGVYKFGIPIIEKKNKKKINTIYFPMIKGVFEKEMHSSDCDDNKINIFEDFESVLNKIKKNNSLKVQINKIIFPMFEISKKNKPEEIAHSLVGIWS